MGGSRTKGQKKKTKKEKKEGEDKMEEEEKAASPLGETDGQTDAGKRDR